MSATLKSIEKLAMTPLIDFQSTEFAKQYDLGKWWSMYGDEQGQGPVPASYLVTNLKRYGQREYFGTNDLYHLHHLGFLFGMYHGGLLLPQTGERRPDVTTLAFLDHPDARHGYDAGREFYFVDAQITEQRMTEEYLIQRLRDGVSEMTSWNDEDETWFFFVGCILGELSGPLFPLTPAEQQIYPPKRQQVEQAHARQLSALPQPLQHIVLQEV